METRTGDAPSEYSPPCPWPVRTCAALMGLAYLLLARFSLLFVVQPEQIAGFWLPNGFLIGVMVLRERCDWRCLLASGGLANLIANLWAGNSLGLSFGFAVVNVVESWLAAWALVRYAGTPITLTRLKQVFGLIAMSAVPACACGAVLGAMLVSLTTDGAAFIPVWRIWMVADLLGLLLITPLVIAWGTSGKFSVRALPRARWAEAIGLLVLLLGITGLVSQQTPNTVSSLFIRPYFVVPLLFWSAMRFGSWGTSSATLAIALVAVWSTLQGRGPIPKGDVSVTIQLWFIGTLGGW